MKMRKLRVRDKRGYTYLKKDLGKPGRGKPFVKKGSVVKGILGPDFFSKGDRIQKAILTKEAQVRGERSVQGQLQYVANLQRRTNPSVASRAHYLRGWVAGKFVGKRRVR